MKVTMDFDRKCAEIMIAVAIGGTQKITKAMTDEELVKKAFDYASTYGFCNMQIVDEENKNDN